MIYNLLSVSRDCSILQEKNTLCHLFLKSTTPVEPYQPSAMAFA
jgi:hypothetical protein